MSFTEEFWIDSQGGRHTSPRPFRLSDEDGYEEGEALFVLLDDYDEDDDA